MPEALSSRKRLLFFAVLVATLWVSAEALSFLAGALLTGRVAWMERAQRQREDILARSAEDVERKHVLHPYFGYVLHPPDVGGVGPSGEPRRVPVSSFGLPGNESPIQERRDDSLIIGILGGSVASYFAQFGSERLKSELARAESYRGREIRIVNLAVGGYKQPQQLMAASYLLTLGAEFDVFINIDGFNEVALHEAENGPKGVFPSFPRNWYSLAGAAHHPDALRRIGRTELVRGRQRRIAEIFSQPPLSHSPLANSIAEALRLGYHRRLVALREDYRNAVEEEPGFAVSGPDLPFADRDSLYSHLVGVWERGSMQLERLSRSNGIAYYHFLQPNQYVPDSKPMQARERARAVMSDHPYRPGVLKGYPLLMEAGENLARRGCASPT